MNSITFNSNGDPSQFPSIQEGTGRFNDTDQFNFTKPKQLQPKQENQQTNQNIFQRTKTQNEKSRNTFQPEIVEEKPISQNEEDENFCFEHQDKKAAFVCLQLGCPRVNFLMCNECANNHPCKNSQPLDVFLSSFQEKFQEYDTQVLHQIDLKKKSIIAEIKTFCNQMVEQFTQKMLELEILINKRIMSDESNILDLSEQFMNSLMKCELSSLSKLSDFQQISQMQSTTIKLLQNQFISIPTIFKLLISEIDQVQQRINSFKQGFNIHLQKYLKDLEEEIRGVNYYAPFQKSQSISSLQLKKFTEAQITQFKESQTITGHKGSQIVDFCLISDNVVASASNAGDIILWKLPNFTALWKFQHGIECTSITICKDELKQTFLVSSGRTNQEYQIYLWNLEYRLQVAEVTGHNHPLRKVISLEDQKLAWCSQDPIVRIWNLKERRSYIDITHHTAWINDLCLIKPNILASCSRDQTLSTFDYVNGKTRYIIKDETYVNCLTSINNEIFAYGNYNGVIKIYQTEYPILVVSIHLNSSWLESNCLWYIDGVNENIIVCSSLNGKIQFINIDHHKKRVIKEIKLSNDKYSSPVLWMRRTNQLLAAFNQSLKVYNE